MEGTSVHAPYHNLGFGISSEGGIRFNFLKNQDGSNWFIEPQVQLSYYPNSAGKILSRTRSLSLVK